METKIHQRPFFSNLEVVKTDSELGSGALPTAWLVKAEFSFLWQHSAHKLRTPVPCCFLIRNQNQTEGNLEITARSQGWKGMAFLTFLP